MANFVGRIGKEMVATALALSILVACSPSASVSTVPKNSPMGMDAFGHTRMSEERTTLSADERGHAERLIVHLRTTLAKYRTVAAAERDGYLPAGEDVPVGQLKHFANDADVGLAKNWFAARGLHG